MYIYIYIYIYTGEFNANLCLNNTKRFMSVYGTTVFRQDRWHLSIQFQRDTTSRSVHTDDIWQYLWTGTVPASDIHESFCKGQCEIWYIYSGPYRPPVTRLISRNILLLLQRRWGALHGTLDACDERSRVVRASRRASRSAVNGRTSFCSSTSKCLKLSYWVGLMLVSADLYIYLLYYIYIYIYVIYV